MHPLVAEYVNIWRSEDLQGKLEPSDERPGFTEDSPRITKNENGVLFATMAYFKMDQAGILPSGMSTDFNNMLYYSEVPAMSGLYYRRWMDKGIRQSHDNIVALAAGSLLFGTYHRHLIASYGVKNGWCYNVQAPDKYDVRCCLQGGDVAFIKLMLGWTPAWWEMLWLTVGLSIVPHDAGKVNLAWLRFAAIDKAKKEFKFHQWVLVMESIARFIFDIRHKKNDSYSWAIEQYFFRKDLDSIYIRLDKLANEVKLK